MARTFVAASSDRLYRTTAPIAARPFTIAAWVKPTTLPANAAIVALQRHDGSDHGAYIRIDGASHLRAQEYDGTSSDSVSAGTLTIGSWVHVAALFDASAGVTAYLNGVAASAGAARTPTTPLAFAVGALWAATVPGSYWNGAIAEVSIWNALLSGPQLTALVAGDSAALVAPASLVAYYKILGTSSPEPDEKGGTALTVVGTSQSTHPTINYGTSPGAGRMFQVFD